jgi:hypothetical protein
MEVPHCQVITTDPHHSSQNRIGENDRFWKPESRHWCSRSESSLCPAHRTFRAVPETVVFGRWITIELFIQFLAYFAKHSKNQAEAYQN